MRGPPSWQGLTALVLAVLAGGAVLTLAIGSLLVRAIALDPSEAELLGTVIGAAIGSLATYLGAARRPPDA